MEPLVQQRVADFEKVCRARENADSLNALRWDLQPIVEQAIRRHATGRLMRTEDARVRLRDLVMDELPKALRAYDGRATLQGFIAACVIMRIPKVYYEIRAELTGERPLTKRERHAQVRMEEDIRARAALFQQYEPSLLLVKSLRGRQVFVLYFRKGWDHSRIAGELRISEDLVRQVKRRVLQKLERLAATSAKDGDRSRNAVQGPVTVRTGLQHRDGPEDGQGN